MKKPTRAQRDLELIRLQTVISEIEPQLIAALADRAESSVLLAASTDGTESDGARRIVVQLSLALYDVMRATAPVAAG